MYDKSKIRNFSIVAHIDHGKSTLADRIIEKTGLLTRREMKDQILDNMEIERERGITIKSQAVRLVYHAKDGVEYIYNLIDTPGHVDFNYEVSRSLAACDGALLIVDATQGIEAQTLANAYLALDNSLEILPVINKIDLPSAKPAEVKKEIENILCIIAEDAPEVSAKEGTNIDILLDAIAKKLPPPSGDEDGKLAAMIFDAVYDAYRGVIIFCRIKEGTIKKGSTIRLMATNKKYEVVELGYFGAGTFIAGEQLSAGEVGYIIANIKNLQDTKIGDTITDHNDPVSEPLPGYKTITPMVFCGLYLSDGSRYEDLKEALEKLKLNDASLTYEAESSEALGFGFRAGFLGLLHMEIIQERLEREYNIDLVTTAPSVTYKVIKTDGTAFMISNPSDLPEVSEILEIQEPIIKAEVITPTEYIGAVMELSQERRGVYKSTDYIDTGRVVIHYHLPLNEVIYDFFDVLKSRTKGYASFDYEFIGYELSSLVKVDIMINREKVDALSSIIHKSNAELRGRKMTEKLKEEIPRQMFEIPIQAAIGSKIIARETVSAMRKDVLAKCYGGDISRKRKLLEKQKEGKKRMRQVGNVSIPQSAFMSILKLD